MLKNYQLEVSFGFFPLMDEWEKTLLESEVMTENTRITWPTKQADQVSYGLPKTVIASTGLLGSVSGPLCTYYYCYIGVTVELLIKKDISNSFVCAWDSFLPLGCFIDLCYLGSCLSLILSCFVLFG